jgi:anti-sigma-K factor RskA
MTTSDTHPHDDLAVYALDALEPGERAVVDAHLATCAACREELDGYQRTLGRMTVPEEPPDQVWAGISEQIRATALPPETSDGDLPAEVVSLASRRPGWLRSPRVLAAAAAVVLVLGVGAVLVSLRGSDSLRDQAVAAADDPDNTVVELTSDSGEVARVVVTDGEDYVLFDDLPTLASDETYQLWRTDDGLPASLGVLGDAGDGAAKVQLPASTSAFAISQEPKGGSTSPTDVVATGQLA